MKLEKYELKGELIPIFTYPDPVLSKISVPVTEFGPNLQDLVKNMLFTMYHAPGIGLAAPQVGHNIRLFVLDVDFEREEVTTASGAEEFRLSGFNPKIFVNPIITSTSGTITYEEGCLSLPGIYEEVKRHESVHVKYQDLEGNFHELVAEDMLAICLQHENDHLDGVVFIERLSNLKKNFYKKKMLKEKVR